MSQKYDSAGDKVYGRRAMLIGMSTEGNTAGISGLASKQLVFVGLGALSLSQSLVAGYGTISFSVPSQSNQTIGLYASSQTTGASSSMSADARSITFVGQGNISIGMSNGSMLISGAGGGGGGGTLTFFASSNTTGQSSSSSFNATSLVFRGAGIASVGYSAGEIVFSVPSGGGVGDGGNVLAAGTQTATSLGTVQLADSNGISFGMSGSTRITASYTVPSQISAFAVGNSTQSSSGTIPFSAYSIRGDGDISVGVSNGSIIISGSAAPQFSAGLSNGGNTSGNSGTVTGRLVFAGGNNITLSGSTNGGSMSITISGPNTQSWFSQAGISNLGNTAGDTGMVGSRLVFVGAGAVSLSQATAAGGLGTVSINVTIPSQTAQTIGLYASSNTTGQSSSSTFDARTLSIRGAGVASVGMSGGELIISVPPGGGGDGYNILAAGTQTATSAGTVAFVNSNGISFGMSGSTQITASYTVPTQSVQTIGLYASSQTTGQSSSSTVDARSITFVGAGIVSVGLSGGSYIISATGGGGGGPAISAAGASASNGTIVFSNSNSISFGMNGSTVTASFSQSNQAFSAGGGSSSFQTLNFRNANGLSFSNSNGSVEASYTVPSVTEYFSRTSTTFNGANISGSITLNTAGLQLSLSAAAPGGAASQTLYATGNTTVNSSGTQALSSILFRGYGILSVGTSNGSILLSTPDAVDFTSFSAGMSNLGNTAGGTGVVTGRMVLVGTNGISLSGSTDAGSATISINFSQSAQTLGLYASSQTTGQSSSSTVDARSITFVGAGGVSVGLSAGSYIISGGAGGGGAFTAGISGGNTAGDTGTVSNRVVFAGGANITLSGSTNGGSQTISIVGRAGYSAGLSNLGNTAGATGLTGTNMVFVGSGPISLSQTTGANGGTISIIGPATSSLSATGIVSISTNGSTISIGAPAFSAGMSTQGNTQGDTGFASQRIVFVGTNNITLSGSTNGGSMTISISGGAGAAGNTGYLSAGANTASLGTIVLSESNGITFGLNGQTLTASHNALTSQSNQAFSASGGSSAFQTLNFVNGNGATFTNNAGSVGISYTVPTQSAQTIGLYASSQTTGQSSSSTVDARSITFVGQGLVSVGLSGGSYLISVTAPTQTAQTIGLYASSQTTGQSSSSTVDARSVTFVGAGNVSVGLSGGSYIISGAAGGQSNQTGGIYFVGNTTGQSSSSTYDARTLSIDGAGIVSVGWSAGSVRISASVPAQTVQTVGLYASSQTTGQSSSSTVDARSITFVGQGLASVGLSAGSYLISVTAPAQTNQSIGLYASSQTTGQSSSSTVDARSITFVGQGIVSVGLSGGSYLVSATQSGQAASASNGSFSFQTLNFSNANNVTFGTSAGGIVTASVSAQSVQTIGLYASSQTTGQSSSSTVDARSISFVGQGLVSVGLSGGSYLISATAPAQTAQTIGLYASSQTTGQSSSSTVDARSITFVGAGGVSVGLSGGSYIISGGAGGGGTAATLYATGNTTQSSTGTQAISSLIFRGEGVASVGITNGSVVISVPSGGGGGFTGGMSTQGNTAGTTGLVSNQLIFVGSGPISLSQSVNGQSATLSINAPATSSLVAFRGAVISTAGSTISFGQGMESQFQNFDFNWMNSTTMRLAQSTSHIQPFVIEAPVSFGVVRLLMTASMAASTTAATTGNTQFSYGLTHTHNFVIYSRGTGASSQSLISMLSTSFSEAQSHNISANANSTQFSHTNRFTYYMSTGTTEFNYDYSTTAASLVYNTTGMTAVTGNKVREFPWAASLPPGEYWLMYGQSSSSTSQFTNVGTRYFNPMSNYGMSQPNIAFGLIGSATNNSVGPYFGQGSFSTAGGGTTSGFNISAVTTSGSHNKAFFALYNIA